MVPPNKVFEKISVIIFETSVSGQVEFLDLNFSIEIAIFQPDCMLFFIEKFS